MEESNEVKEIREAIFKNLEARGGRISEELKKYLVDDRNLPYINNIFTYEELTWGKYKGLVEPLEFFNLLYAAYAFVTENKANPRTIIGRLDEMNLPADDKHFFLTKLSHLIRTGGRDLGNEQDKAMVACLGYILEMVKNLEVS